MSGHVLGVDTRIGASGGDGARQALRTTVQQRQNRFVECILHAALAGLRLPANEARTLPAQLQSVAREALRRAVNRHGPTLEHLPQGDVRSAACLNICIDLSRLR